MDSTQQQKCGCACVHRLQQQPWWLPPSLWGDGWAGRRTHLSGGDATLLSSHAGRSFTPDAGKTNARQPEGDTQAMSQTPGVKDPTTARSGALTLTLSDASGSAARVSPRLLRSAMPTLARPTHHSGLMNHMSTMSHNRTHVRQEWSTGSTCHQGCPTTRALSNPHLESGRGDRTQKYRRAACLCCLFRLIHV